MLEYLEVVLPITTDKDFTIKGLTSVQRLMTAMGKTVFLPTTTPRVIEAVMLFNRSQPGLIVSHREYKFRAWIGQVDPFVNQR